MPRVKIPKVNYYPDEDKVGNHITIDCRGDNDWRIRYWHKKLSYRNVRSQALKIARLLHVPIYEVED